MDADGQDYEAYRQKNIRENAEFLLSLFKDVSLSAYTCTSAYTHSLTLTL